jgi:hypothetical protein
MSHLLKFNSDINFSEDYLKKYARFVDLPSCTYLDVKFHPILKDHIIVLSEIYCPKKCDYQTLVNEKMYKGFVAGLDRKYVKYAERKVVRRGIRGLAGNLSKKNVSDSSMYDSSIASFDNSDVVMEGGSDRVSSGRTFQKPKKIDLKRPDYVHGSYPKMTRSKPKGNTMLDEPGKINQEIFDRAADLYLEEKSKMLTYKTMDPSLNKADVQISSDDEYSSSDSDSDTEFNEQNEFDDKLTIEFKELPKYQGFQYTPPPIKHKYEISIWKTNSYGVVKIKSSYFTPESDKINDLNFSGFKMDISIDKETIILYEKSSKQKESLVMLFDIYTLDTIFEDDINTINKENKTYTKKYDQDQDFYHPEQGKFCPTSPDFPRFSSFGNGKFILVSVGDHPKSK